MGRLHSSDEVQPASKPGPAVSHMSYEYEAACSLKHTKEKHEKTIKTNASLGSLCSASLCLVMAEVMNEMKTTASKYARSR